MNKKIKELSKTIFIVLLLIIVFTVQGPVSRALTTPNDPQFPSQWAPVKIRAPEAWDITKGNASIKVAVVATGITSTLPDLQGQLGTGYNAITPGGSTEDDFVGYGWGTLIAGIIGAKTNNGLDMAGIAWNVTILPIKVCDRAGNCDPTDLAEGINWAANNGAQIINIPIQSVSQNPSVDAAIADAISKGIIVVATAGNVPTRVAYPAALPAVIAVGSTDSNDLVTSWSGRGPELDIVAPGVSVLTLVRAGCCVAQSGSEIAAAQVSGALAILLAAGVPASQAPNYLYQGAVDLGTPGRDDTYGWGRLDVCRALNAAGKTCPVPSSAPTADIKANGSDGPITISYNTSATISWSATNASSCLVSSTGWTGTSGSQSTGNLTSSQTYTLACSGPGGSASDSVTVNVSAPPVCTRANPTVSLIPSSQDAKPGGLVNYTLTVTNNDSSSCLSSTFSLTNSVPVGWSASFSPTSLNLSPAASGSATLTVTSATTATPGSYTISAIATNSSDTNFKASTSANYVVIPAPTADIKANGSDGPITIGYNTSATISWASTNTTGCSVSPTGWMGTSGSQSTGNLTLTTTYSLNCTGSGGSASDSVIVNVSAPPICTRANPAVTMTPTSQSGTAGSTLNYNLSVTNNDSSACASSTFNLSSSIPTGWTATFTPASLSLAPGASAGTILSVTSATTASPGSYSISAKVTNSSDSSFNASSSATDVVTDITKPTVSIMAPSNGSTVSGTVNVTANASDNIGVTKVEFWVDSSLKTTDTIASYSFSWDTTAETNGSHSLQAKAYDAAGNSGISTPVSVTVFNDITPPSISNILVTNIAQTSATITWTTDEPATSQVEYGLTTAYGSQTNLDTNLVTSHSQNLTSLSAGTLYNYRVNSKDAANNQSLSINYTFTTLSPPQSDTTPPAKITNLRTSKVTGTSVKLSWTAPGDDGTQGIAYQYDIRYSTSLTSEASWNSATQVGGEPTPGASGTSQSFTVVGLSPSTSYYFAIKTLDEVPNWSELSNIVSATTLTSSIKTLSVSLTANPFSGIAPLNNVDLTATVSGISKGTINYIFYCNRTDNGTNITLDYAKRVNNTKQNPYTTTDVCSYSSPGQYRAKVIVENGKLAAEARVDIFVTSAMATISLASTLSAEESFIPTTSDSIFPQPVANFQALAGDSQILLFWQNPPDPDFVRVRILRKLNDYSYSPTEGDLIYEGDKTSFVDTNLTNEQTYYYSIFAYNEIPNYSLRTVAKAIPNSGIISIPLKHEAKKPSTSPTSKIPIDYKFTKSLYLGQKNNEVNYLQTFLKEQGTEIYPQGLITGYFGSLTKAAVINFQMKYGIVSSPSSPGAGLVGLKTRAEINEILGK